MSKAAKKLLMMPGRPIWVQSAKTVKLPRSGRWGSRHPEPTHELRVRIDKGRGETFAKLVKHLGIGNVRMRIDEARPVSRERTMHTVLENWEVVTKPLVGKSIPGNNRFR